MAPKNLPRQRRRASRHLAHAFVGIIHFLYVVAHQVHQKINIDI